MTAGQWVGFSAGDSLIVRIHPDNGFFFRISLREMDSLSLAPPSDSPAGGFCVIWNQMTWIRILILKLILIPRSGMDS